MPAGAVKPAVGWYGKVAMLGDFAHRRLAPDVVRRVDAWLAGWVAESRAALGDERWRAAYLTAPVLRFAWGPGLEGPTGWFGVLMPSCDRAGRYFPLWVAEPCAVADAGGPGSRRAWFDRIAMAATGTLDDGASVDAFEAALADAGALPGVCDAPVVAATPSPGSAAAASHWWAATGGGVGVATLAGLPEPPALTRLWLGC